jgi:alkylhydroperoxidase family enzyme
MGDDERANLVETALKAHQPEDAFDGQHLAALQYAAKLTVSPGKMIAADIVALRKAGWDDGEILEINQIVGYFNYANRLLNGLGVTTDGDVVGYYKTN